MLSTAQPSVGGTAPTLPSKLVSVAAPQYYRVSKKKGGLACGGGTARAHFRFGGDGYQEEMCYRQDVEEDEDDADSDVDTLKASEQLQSTRRARNLRRDMTVSAWL